MELKFEKRRNHRQIRDSSNRTFMELKYHQSHEQRYGLEF